MRGSLTLIQKRNSGRMVVLSWCAQASATAPSPSPPPPSPPPAAPTVAPAAQAASALYSYSLYPGPLTWSDAAAFCRGQASTRTYNHISAHVCILPGIIMTGLISHPLGHSAQGSTSACG